jgi:predicted transcriptional regulator
MSRTVTLRVDDTVYRKLRSWAERDNRPLSNFIETAALRFIEDHEVVDEFEMKEIASNTDLNASMKRGIKDANAGRGRFV